MLVIVKQKHKKRPGPDKTGQVPVDERYISMRKSLLLKVTPAMLHAWDEGVRGYAPGRKGWPCHFWLSDGRCVRVGVIGADIGPRFECFSLDLEFIDEPQKASIAFEGKKASILLREEYIEPFDGDPSAAGYVGGPPAFTQSGGKLGAVPSSAVASCVVAFGLLLDGQYGQLVVVADWLPFNIEIATDPVRIEEILVGCEVLSTLQYLEKYGVLERGV